MKHLKLFETFVNKVMLYHGTNAEYFQRKGFDGIKYQSGDFEKIKSHNYVIYNEKSIKE